MNLKIKNIVNAFLFVGFLFFSQSVHAATDAIIAIVNDDVITLKDLRQYIAGVASQLRVENKSKEEFQQIMQEYEQKGLDKLIEDKLILAAANDKGMEVRDEIVDKRLQEIRTRYASDDDFVKALGSQGMTISDLKKKLTDQMKVKYVVDMEVRDKIFINPENVTQYYNAHVSDYAQKPRVNLQSIFISFAKHSRQEAQTLSDESRSHLMAGEPFDPIFKKYSERPSVGEIEKGQMVDAIENVVFNLKMDEVSSPVEVGDGIYVFKVIGVTPGAQQGLSEVKDQIYEKLMDDAFQAKFKEWIDKLRKKAYVEIK